MNVYLRTKFYFSSTILTSFRQVAILAPPPSLHQKEPLKSPPRLELKSNVRKRRFIKKTVNERLLLSATFTAKFEFELVFVLTHENASF